MQCSLFNGLRAVPADANLTRLLFFAIFVLFSLIVDLYLFFHFYYVCDPCLCFSGSVFRFSDLCHSVFFIVFVLLSNFCLLSCRLSCLGLYVIRSIICSQRYVQRDFKYFSKACVSLSGLSKPFKGLVKVVHYL